MRLLAPLVFGAMAVSASALAQTAPSPASPPNAAACDDACIRANTDRAVQACAPRIEAEAPGDYEWVTRPVGTIFQEADKPEAGTPSIVRYRGDSIRFTSPQKEQLRAIYECGYDTAKRQVAYVRVRLGVLGKPSAVPAAQSNAQQAAAPAAAPRAPQAVPAPATVNLRLIGEPSAVDVRQIPTGAKPLSTSAAP